MTFTSRRILAVFAFVVAVACGIGLWRTSAKAPAFVLMGVAGICLLSGINLASTARTLRSAPDPQPDDLDQWALATGRPVD